ncbi:MAG TPA: BamA/TamA family outer membrane protein [Polyangia bacterium]|nr:BamA/TamA family outer membrane protein [Polyangia bacterium]
MTEGAPTPPVAAATATVDTTGTPPRPPTAPPADALPPANGKRAVPEYDGREPPAPTAREGFAWIPRLVLSPAYLTSEYVVRRPIIGLVRWGEAHYVWRRIYDAATWDGGRAGVYPTANVDLGLKQTAGLSLFWHDFGRPASSLSASASGGIDVLSAGARERLGVFRDHTGAVTMRAGYSRRPDGIFYGIGPDSRVEDRVYFGFTTIGGGIGLDGKLGGLSHAVLDLGYRRAAFRSSPTDGPDIRDRYGGPGQPPLPAGFEGYELVEPRALLLLDSRDPNAEVPGGTGARLELAGGYAIDPARTDIQYASWGGQGAVFYDASGAGHVLGAAVDVRFVEPIGAHDVPFSELPALGGNETMRGFLAGRLRGPSTFTAALQYRYPFWAFVDGELFSEVGNAFGAHLDGIDPRRMFLSYGGALRTTFSRETSISMTLAFATSRFDEPAFSWRDNVRFSIGVNNGF